jgi:hypothetical protein
MSCPLDTGHDELNKLVSEVNVHSHTSSCQRGTLACRFNFPKLPSDETLIASPLPTDLSEEERDTILSESKAILAVVKEKLDIKNLTDEDIDKKYKNDLKSFLKDLDIDYEAYKKAIRISERGQMVVLKRTLKERNVNNFNKEWMLAWRANLDLQFCYDGFAVVTYLTDYFSKADAGVTAALKKGFTETKGWNDFQIVQSFKIIPPFSFCKTLLQSCCDSCIRFGKIICEVGYHRKSIVAKLQVQICSPSKHPLLVEVVDISFLQSSF